MFTVYISELSIEPPLVAPVEDGGEDEQDGHGAQRVELGEEGGRLQVDEGEDEDGEEEGHGGELAPDHVEHGGVGDHRGEGGVGGVDGGEGDVGTEAQGVVVGAVNSFICIGVVPAHRRV